MPMTMAHVEFDMSMSPCRRTDGKMPSQGVSIGDVAEAFDSFCWRCGFSPETIDRMGKKENECHFPMAAKALPERRSPDG